MFARVAVLGAMPDDDRLWVIDAAKTFPGVLNAYHLVDPDSGSGLSIAFFHDDVDVTEVKRRARQEGQGDRLERRPASGAEVGDDLPGHQMG